MRCYSSETLDALKEAQDHTQPNHSETLEEVLDYMRREYTGLISNSSSPSKALVAYNSNVKRLTYKIGCAEAHQDPERNIAELRKFHATQMPFFAKLQDDFQAQIKENNEQKEIITALVFRHLLENLPPSQTRSGDTNSTPRRREFWGNAARKELGNQHPDHPLHGLMPPNAITSTGVFSAGKTGHSFRTGSDLHGTLSENIHSYKSGGRNEYGVKSDQWGLSIRKVLNALIPKEFDADGEVKWDEERKRYL